MDFFFKIPLRVLLLSRWIGSSVTVISPAGLPVPKKVTARKQEASASPGSGDCRAAVLNVHPAQALSPTSGSQHLALCGGTQNLGWEVQEQPAGRGHGDTAVAAPTGREESGLLPLPRPLFVEVPLSSKETAPLFNFLPSPLPSASGV